MELVAGFRSLMGEVEVPMTDPGTSDWMSTVIDLMPLGVVIHAADGLIIAVNPAACTILGLTADQLLGLTSRDPRWHAIDAMGQPIAGDDHPAMVALRTGATVTSRLLGISDPLRKGRCWIQVSATPQFTPGAARPHRAIVLFEDVTARHEAEARSSTAEGSFRALFENSPIGVAHHRMIRDASGRDIDYLFLDANANYLLLTGVDPRDKLVTEAFPGIEHDPFDWIGRFGHVARTGESIRFQQHLLANDRWYDCVGYRTEPNCFVAAFLEITEQKRAEQALRASEEHQRITLDSIGDAVIATDAQGRVTRMNRVAETLTGWSQAEASGRDLPEIFQIINAGTRSPCVNPVERVLATNLVVGLANHTALIHRDGSERQIADSGAPIRNDDGAVVGVVLVFRDVTGEYALQEQLAQSRKLDALGQLAGGIAHDFNNMLAGIMVAADLLRIRMDDHEKRGRLLDAILSASDRAAGLTRKLLTFARKGQMALAPTHLHQAVTDAVSLLEHSLDKRIVLQVRLEALQDLVEGDLSGLQNLFLNLGINAAHAMPEGGTLVFATRDVQIQAGDEQYGGFALAAGAYLEFTATDNGRGIAPEHLPRIFDPFFTTKPLGQGTGLGLTTAYGTARQHHGAITVASDVGRGTTFTVLLPLSGVAVSDPVPVEAAPAFRGSGRALLVEDEEMLRTTARMILESLGFTVVEAVNGAEAVTLYAADTAGFALVVVDMVMPVMNGRSCCERICALNPQARILLCSGYSQEEDVAALRKLGIKTMLNKPYRQAEFVAAVAAAITPAAG